jgi:perosamine synthetase
VHSPLPWRGVLAGTAGALRGAGGVRERVGGKLAHAFGAEDVLLTDSGTSALALAISGCLAERPGSAVALPGYACYDLATAADGADVPVVLYDVDPATLAPRPDSLQRALVRNVGAVVVVHLYGVPVDLTPVWDLVRRTGIWVIEDAAQAAGASVAGRPVGSAGDVTVLSFGRGKGITAGRGGALLARSSGVAVVARARRALLPPLDGAREAVQLAAQWLLGRPALYAVPAALPFLRLGETLYHAPARPRALSGAGARTLEATWPLAAQEAAGRRERAAALRERAGPGLGAVAVPREAVPGYLRLPFVAAPLARAAAEGSEAQALGIMPGYPSALCDLAGFATRVRNAEEPFDGARLLAKRLVTLPTHSLLTARDLAHLGAWAARW